MKLAAKFGLLLALPLLSPAAALADVCPQFTYGAVLTAGQWQACFDAKQNALGYTPLNVAGGTMTGRLVISAPTGNVGFFNLAPGSTPGAPLNGDMWTTSSGLFVRINGSTVGPLSGGGASTFVATSPLTVTNIAGTVTYAFDFTVANTFLAQQTNQGATTTSPGWYTQIAGDTTPRVRVGVNATDVASLAFGPGNAVRDTFIERVSAAFLRQGAPDAAAPVAQTSGVQNVVAGTSNTAGADRTFAASRGTGTGVGGAILFQTAPAGSTGSTQNALVTAAKIFGTGGINVGTPTGGDKGAGTINATGIFVNGSAVGSGGSVTSIFCGATLTCTPNPIVTTGTIALALGNANTWTAVQSFTDGDLSLLGSGSGNSIVKAPATGGGTATLFAGSDTILGAASTATLTNKTFDTAGTGNVFKIAGVTISSVTGTGANVLATSPSLVTPSLGVASATTVNKYTLTPPATGSTLTIADGKTFVVNNSITLVGTDSTSWTGPSTNATLAALNIQGQTLTGGANVTAASISTGSFTVNCGNRPIQTVTNNGAYTITAPAAGGSCFIKVTNGASAGATTFSGFAVGSNIGDSLDTVNGHIFYIAVVSDGTTATYSVKATQ